MHLCLQELQQQSLGFFSTLVFSFLLPLRASLLHFLSPQTYQQYGNVWKTLLLQMLPQPCQHWQCKGILHGGSRGCLCWTQILLTGSLQGKAEREIAPSCWNQTGIELNHIYSSGGKFLELSSHRMPGFKLEGILIDHLIPTPVLWAGTSFHLTKLLRSPFNLNLNNSRGEVSTASLANLSVPYHTYSEEFSS